MSAELAARRTAAAAVLGDFDAIVSKPLPTWASPQWAYWAGRLASELRSVLEITGQEMSCRDKGSVKRDNVHEA